MTAKLNKWLIRPGPKSPQFPLQIDALKDRCSNWGSERLYQILRLMVKHVLYFYTPWMDLFIFCCYTYFLDSIESLRRDWKWKRSERDGMGEEVTGGDGRREQWMGWKRTTREVVGEKGTGKASHAPAGSFLAWEMSYHRISIPNYFFLSSFFLQPRSWRGKRVCRFSHGCSSFLPFL